MQIRIFTVSIHDTGEEQAALNGFLRGNRILSVEPQLVQTGNTAFWSFCVSYLVGTGSGGSTRDRRKGKIDYKRELDSETFARFEGYRKIRKALAAEDAVPAFAIFSNAELAQIAALEELSIANLRKIPGIGAKKIERFGTRFLSRVQHLNVSHEANGQPLD